MQNFCLCEQRESLNERCCCAGPAAPAAAPVASPLQAPAPAPLGAAAPAPAPALAATPAPAIAMITGVAPAPAPAGAQGRTVVATLDLGGKGVAQLQAGAITLRSFPLSQLVIVF